MKKTITKKQINKAVETLKTMEIVESSKAETTAEKQQKPKRGEHLKEHGFKPGQSGNPKGRPKGVKNFHTVFAIALQNVANELNKKNNGKLTGDQVYERIMESLVKQGINGNARHLELILAYVIGKPKHQEGDKLELDVVVVDEDEAKAIREAVKKAGIAGVSK
jgi:hypothetical protein